MFPKSVFLLAFLFFFSFSASAEKKWNDGVVVLKDNTVLTGELLMDSDLNLLQVKHEGKVQTFAAYKVELFYFYDQDLAVLRKHISLPYSINGNIFKNVFYEEIIKGEISLLRKESFNTSETTLEENVYTSQGHMIDNNRFQEILSYDYFYSLDNEIVHSKKFEKDLFPLLEVNFNNEGLKNHISQNNLRTYKLYDQIQIIKYLNESFTPDKQLSSRSK